MPPNLSPEIMYGMSLIEKTEHFQKIITALESLQEFYINISVEEKAKALKLPKKQSKSVMIKSKSYREKANEVSETLKKIRGNYEAPYQMLPLYHYSTIKQEVQVINKELSLAQMLFQYSPDTSVIESKQLCEIVYFLDKKELGSFDGSQSFDKIVSVPTKAAFLEKGIFSLQIFTDRHSSKEQKIGELELKQEAFRLTNEINASFNSPTIQFRVTLKIRQATRKDEIKLIEKSIIVIDKLFPLCIIPEIPVLDFPLLKSKSEDGIPAGLREIDINDPDDVGNLICVSYLEKKIKFYTSFVEKASNQGRKVPTRVKEKLQTLTLNHVTLMKEIDQGRLTPHLYKTYLQKQASKDQSLLSYFSSKKMENKVQIVRERLHCIMNELHSFESQY
eukprot:TRINITY_DN18195_c0_g1_i2.p1 TRINITY_DN18195_c0_g1~~TRINITY_DN18195_c0_g1_i2.p1  ORF type:complete len:391 (-),score=66.17 TRINITY_DN18195_c0_g1_i2:62-1234(-)